MNSDARAPRNSYRLKAIINKTVQAAKLPRLPIMGYKNIIPPMEQDRTWPAHALLISPRHTMILAGTLTHHQELNLLQHENAVLILFTFNMIIHLELKVRERTIRRKTRT